MEQNLRSLGAFVLVISWCLDDVLNNQQKMKLSIVQRQYLISTYFENIEIKWIQSP